MIVRLRYALCCWLVPVLRLRRSTGRGLRDHWVREASVSRSFQAAHRQALDRVRGIAGGPHRPYFCRPPGSARRRWLGRELLNVAHVASVPHSAARWRRWTTYHRHQRPE